MRKTIYIFPMANCRERIILSVLIPRTEKYLPVEDINEIFLFGEVDLNKRFLEFAAQKEILIHYFNYYGYYMGTFILASIIILAI